MPAAQVDGLGMMPEAEPFTVEEALVSIRSFLDPDREYKIEWCEFPKESVIVQRFSRRLGSEAWLLATPIGPDGKKERDAGCVACAITIDGAVYPSETAMLEQKLRDDLAVAKENL